MAQPFTTIHTKSSELNRIQANISSTLNSNSGPFTGGVLLQNITVGTSNTVVNHGLGRAPEVWVVCDQNTNTNVWRVAWSATSITLIAGSSCNVSLWVN